MYVSDLDCPLNLFKMFLILPLLFITEMKKNEFIYMHQISNVYYISVRYSIIFAALFCSVFKLSLWPTVYVMWDP
jgi:hypothetical protein